MAVARIVNVNEILKAKGLKPKVFNLNIFCSVVSDFFMTHEPKETILLVPKRFIEMDNPPEGDFIDYLDISVWEKKCDDPDDQFDFIDYQFMKKNGMLRPILMVNEPFIGNAAGWLRDFCGFTVKSRTRKKKKEYIVSLPV
nr:MAG TPA: hypothetical protein [Caudoviricetes sp.]